MDAAARAELDAICSELNAVIGELEQVSTGVRRDFAGIGNQRCADCLDHVLERYYFVRRKLNNMDTTRLAQGFQAPGSGGGGGSR